MSNFFEMVGASVCLVMGLMTLLWVVYYFKRNSGIVDIGWAISYILVAWACLWIGDGYIIRKWIMVSLVTVWGGRLFCYLYERFLAHEEDPRYQEIKMQWGDNIDLKFLFMFWFQGLLVIIMSLPFLIISQNPSRDLTAIEAWGCVIWLIGVIGESISDYQLKEFKKSGGSEGKICQKGLWNYSRHPNYFFEWIVWVGYFVFAFSSPGGSFAILSPILMLFLLTRVSGIPITEAHSLLVKGDAYRDYQQTTSAFIPWFKTQD